MQDKQKTQTTPQDEKNDKEQKDQKDQESKQKEKQEKISQKLQENINEDLQKISQVDDFKDYFKQQREIINKYIGTWPYVEKILERDALGEYNKMVKSFGEKAELDAKENKIDEKKLEVIRKFNKQILEYLDNEDYKKTTEQLFYVLLGNILEHIGKADVDMKDFDIQKEVYPKLQLPLGLTFYLFQNLAFGKIATKVNDLSKEYKQKYAALILGIWRTVFELMQYEKMKAQQKEKEENK